MNTLATSLLNRLLARGKFRHLQLVLLLAELGSLQRTAQAVGMTQSAVTQTLAYIEGLLEVPLFHRHARGVRPTAVCQALLPVARAMMQGLQESAEVVHSRMALGRSLVRLVASASASQGLLLDALPRFFAQHPGVQVLLREAEGEDQLLWIARGEVDAVACRQPGVMPEGWRFTPILADELVVVGPRQHPWSGQRRCRVGDLASTTWAVTPAGSAAREQFDQLAATLKQPLRTYPLVTRSPALLNALILQQNLLALLPLSIVRPLVQAGHLSMRRPPKDMPLPPMGLLLPQGPLPEAAEALERFLTPTAASPASTGPATPRPASPPDRSAPRPTSVRKGAV